MCVSARPSQSPKRRVKARLRIGIAASWLLRQELQFSAKAAFSLLANLFLSGTQKLLSKAVVRLNVVSFGDLQKLYLSSAKASRTERLPRFRVRLRHRKSSVCWSSSTMDRRLFFTCLFFALRRRSVNFPSSSTDPRPPCVVSSPTHAGHHLPKARNLHHSGNCTAQNAGGSDAMADVAGAASRRSFFPFSDFPACQVNGRSPAFR